MSRFHYVSSFDEVKWYVNSDNNTCCEIDSANLDKVGRFNLATWINDTCRANVCGWNKCRTPSSSEINWGRMITPQGNIVLFFTDDKDWLMFNLAWHEIISNKKLEI